MKSKSVKNTRINEEVMRELAQIIRELKDPRINMLTSVLAVDVAADLKTAKAYISVLGGDSERDRTLEGLNSSKGYIRRELAHRVNLRNTPELTFIMDSSIEYAQNMFKKIDEVIGNESTDENTDITED